MAISFSCSLSFIVHTPFRKAGRRAARPIINAKRLCVNGASLLHPAAEGGHDAADGAGAQLLVQPGDELAGLQYEVAVAQP